jgi:glycosyltransferase involved in cell wall biosynthesis
VTPRPLVSVCTPTYNYGRFIEDAIRSVLAQTYAEWELVITDDQSTDGTRELVERYAAKEPRIRYHLNEARLGMFANFARATSLARGAFLKPLCADDWLAPGCLEEMVATMSRHPSAVLATSACTVTDEAGIPREVNFLFGKAESFQTGDEMLARMAKGEGFGGNSSFFIRADSFRRVGGYDTSYPYASDYHLGAKLCQVGDYVHMDHPLFYGREHGASSSSTNPRKLLDVADFLTIPDAIFRERRVGSLAWRRYHALMARVTARYLVSAATQRSRGDREMARATWRLVRERGVLVTGLAYAPVEAARRAALRVTGRTPYRRSVIGGTP